MELSYDYYYGALSFYLLNFQNIPRNELYDFTLAFT